MPSVNNILTPAQIRAILKQVNEAFTEQVSGELSINLISFQKQVQQILAESSRLAPVFSTKDPNRQKGITINRLVSTRIQMKQQRLLAKGYMLIFKFREFLLNEKINYRYYYNDSEGAHATQFEEEDILKYIKFGKIAIELNPSELKTAVPAGVYDALIQKYYGIFTGGGYMLAAKNGGSRLLAHSSIVKQYVGRNPGLINQSNPNSHQLFTAGHVYEAIDTAISAYVELQANKLQNIPLNASQEEKALAGYVFGKYLAYDSIKASQGADNSLTNTSIKSGGADLYDYSTIIRQLQVIDSICSAGVLTSEQIQSEISKLFLHKSKFGNSEQLMQQAASRARDKIIKELKIPT